MGCDIHMYREKFVDGKWLTADEWTSYDYGDDDKGMEVKWQKRFTDRNYDLFGLLARGVRRTHAFGWEPRGMPFDPCDEIAKEAERWDRDGHTHSYLFLHELKAMARFIETKTITISGMKNREELAALHESIASGSPDWNLIFPYCQGTNDPKQTDFEIEIPATFYFADPLGRIISAFDGVEGENHRIVFFFDN